MKNEWVVIEIKVKGEFVDLVSAVLDDYGCSGTVIEERALDTFDVPDDVLNPKEVYCLKTYFDAVSSPQLLVSTLENGFNEIPLLEKEIQSVSLGDAVDLEDWAEGWKQNFSSFRIGENLVIRPSWEEYTPELGEVVVEIDPGMAFGTGTHETTQLCLEMIAELLKQTDAPQDMLDVGTGSGILALGAAALGCRKIVANDIDPIACNIARENIIKNRYDSRIEISEYLLEDLPGQHDLVVANILAEENVRLRHAFLEHLRPGGWLVLSGILKEKEGLVQDGFADLGLKSFPSRYKDEWVCLLFQRPF